MWERLDIVALAGRGDGVGWGARLGGGGVAKPHSCDVALPSLPPLVAKRE